MSETDTQTSRPWHADTLRLLEREGHWADYAAFEKWLSTFDVEPCDLGIDASAALSPGVRVVRPD